MTSRPLIRTARADDALALARIHVDTWRTTYVGIVPGEHLAGLSYERSHAKWAEYLSNAPSGAATFVAAAPAVGIVGFASCGPLREALPGFDGELYTMYLRKAFQGMGYGRLLVAQAACHLAGAGYRSLALWVLKDNPACHFYERLGGVRTGEKVIEIGGKALTDVAYGWTDLSTFQRG